MPSLSETDAEYLIERAIGQLDDAIEPSADSSERFVELPIAPLSLRAWLNAQKRFPQWYWASRDGQREYAGVGEALRFSAANEGEIAECEQGLRDFFEFHPQAHRIHAFIGQRFNPSQPGPLEWAEFPAFLAVIPEIMLCRDGEEYRAILVISVEEGEKKEKVVRRVLRALDKTLAHTQEPEPVRSAALAEVSEPTSPAWLERCQAALEMIARGEVSKLVLARSVSLELSRIPRPVDTLHALASSLGEGFSLLFAPSKDVYFACQTPELLFEVVGDTLRSDALGGSTLSEASSDSNFAEQNDEKLRDEHQCVVSDLQQKFATLTDSALEQRATEIVSLPYISHLRTQLAGHIRAGVDALGVLRSIHPTPAVGAYPSAGGVERIAALEGFARGWYSGPVGVLSQERAEFAVALRGVLVRELQAKLYAGAGIVADSKPEQEWAEIEGKLRPVRELFAATESREVNE